MRASLAAQVLLVRAVEETQPARAASPEAAEADAAASAEDAEGEAAWVARRAAYRLGHDLAGYRPLLMLAQAPRAPFIALLIPFGLGALANSLGPAAQIHVLYNPIAVLVAWNLSLYAMLIAAPLLWRRKRSAQRAEGEQSSSGRVPDGNFPHASQLPAMSECPRGVRGWLLGRTVPTLFLRLRRGGREAAASAARTGEVARRFWSLWIDAAGALLVTALRRLFHAAAAALAVGAVAGMFVRGVFFDYAMVWRSTFIRDPASAALALRGVLGPAAFVLGWPQPSRDDAARMMDAAGVPAAAWIGLWAMTALLFVVIPRVLLAAAATLRSRRQERAVALPLDDAYFESLLAGVRKIQIERIETAIGGDVRSATAQLADAVADFVCGRLYDARLVPKLRAFRDAGGSVESLERQMEDECQAFEPELEAQLVRARGEFEGTLAAAIERTLGRSFGVGPNGGLTISAGELSRSSPGGLGTSLGREVGAAVGAAVTAGVSLVVATISGGFGSHLGAAVLVGLLHTTGPVAFLIGGLGGLGFAAMSWYVGREQLAQRMKSLSLPRSIARVVLRDSALERLSEQGREQCRSAVRERLDTELAPLVPQLAEEIWAKLRLALPVVAQARAADASGGEARE
ncbi:MAG: DUF2868 domain-containing protein [Proteobacteria bacterium]|nr:DUF2868 domain-containing protein [Pseudomonadota bacterium]